jgi:nitroreductase
MPTQEAASVNQLIQARWSPRSFRDKPIPDENLRSILEAGRLAASSYNEQPWRFIVGIKGKGPAYDRLLQLLVPANQKWAQNAPVLMITAAKKHFSHNSSPNHYGLHDAGQALANMMLQATELGLHAHAMGGFDHEGARKSLNIPEDYEVGAAVAFGYAGADAKRPELTRKPLSDIAFDGVWNNPLNL